MSLRFVEIYPATVGESVHGCLCSSEQTTVNYLAINTIYFMVGGEYGNPIRCNSDLLEPRQIPIGFFPKKKYRRRMLM